MVAMDQKRVKRSSISAPFLGLRALSSVEVLRSDDLRTVTISSGYQYNPDIVLNWSDTYDHYLVYIHVASMNHDKQRAGYAICRIRSALAASFLVGIIHFLVTHRARAEV